MDINFRIPSKYKPFTPPLVVLIVIFVFSLTLGQFMFDKMTEIRTNITNLEELNKKLDAKKDLLASAPETDLSKHSKTVVAAIPSDDFSLLLLSTMRALANNSNVLVSGFKLDSKGGEKGTNLAELNIATQGNLQGTLAFLNEIKKTSPLMRIGKIGFSIKEGSKVTTNLAINTVWKPLPSTIAKTESNIETLRASEIDLLTKLGELKRPQGLNYSVLAPQGRENPFTY